MESVSTHVDGGPGDSGVPADDQARIRHQFLEAGHNGVFLRETRSPGIVANSLQHVRILESGPTRHIGEDRGMRLVLLKALLLELGQRLKNFLSNEESQQAARDMGWLEGPDMEPSDRDSGGAAKGEDLGYGHSHCRDHRAPQAHQCRDHVPLSIAEGAHQGASGAACRIRLALCVGEHRRCCPDPPVGGRRLILVGLLILPSGLLPTDLQVSLWPCNACSGPCGKILAGRARLQALSNICGNA